MHQHPGRMAWLADDRQILDRLRADTATWDTVAYREGHDADRGRFDLHARRRLGVFLCLQYDRRPSDIALLRYLVAEEIAARRNDSFQGYTDALRIGVTLLADFHEVQDAWLFYRAKMANFDTYGGLDGRFLLCGGVAATVEMIRHSDHPERAAFLNLILKQGVPVCSQDEVDAWWAAERQTLPAHEDDEPPEEVLRYALALGAIAAGRSFLDAWEADPHMQAPSTRWLMYYRDRLGQPELALACAQRAVDEARGQTWERTSALQDVAKFATQTGRFRPALEALEEAGRLLAVHSDWQVRGMGRTQVERGFDLALAAASDATVARRAFELGAAWADQMDSLPLVVLRQAAAAALATGATQRAQRYDRLADDEEVRIYGRRREARPGDPRT